MADLDRIAHISFPDVEGYEDITTGIASGSLSLDEILFGNNIQLGEINANKFEVQLYGITDVAGQRIIVWAVDDGETVSPIFSGIVDSCKLDNMGYYRDVIAYDAFFYLKKRDVSAFWNTYWENNTVSTLGDFRRALLDYVGLDYDDVTLPNDDLIIAKTQDVDMISFTELLSKVCELNFCNPNIGRDGRVQFIQFYVNTEPVDISGLYRGQESSFEDYNTKPITQVRVYNSKKRVYGSSGTGSNVYVIQDNLFLYLKSQSELQTIAQALYTALNGVSYKPADINMVVSDLGLNLGDFVVTAKGVSLVCENVYSGPLLVEQSLHSAGDDGELTSIESLVEQETQNTIAQHTENIEELLETQLVYLLPMTQDGSPIADGTSNTILEWIFECTENAKIQMATTLNFEIETAVDLTQEIYGDAKLSVVYKLDGDAIGTLIQTYGDGDHILTLTYLATVEEAGIHTLSVELAMDGGDLS